MFIKALILFVFLFNFKVLNLRKILFISIMRIIMLYIVLNFINFMFEELKLCLQINFISNKSKNLCKYQKY